MDLTPKQVTLIRESYRRLVPEIDRVSGKFYPDLFRRAPHLRGLFREDLAEQGMKFMSAISVIIAHLDRPEALEARMDELGRGHAAYGISPADYRDMEEALIDTFAHALECRFNSEIEVAWRRAFSQVASRMREVAGESGKAATSG